MIRTVIIDDEPLIREGLSLIIEWERLGYEIVGMADNGYNGYNTIIETKAEVAIVDIMMPDMTGLELVELLKKNNIKCKIIFLTAYADFEYAKKSIELDVCYYLIKPLEEAELEEKLLIISDMIMKEKRYLSFTKEKVLERLVHGNKEVIEGLKKQQFESVDLIWDSFRLILIQYDEKGSQELYNYYVALDLANEVDKCFEDSHVFKLDGNIGILLYEENESKIFRAVSILQKHIVKQFGITPYLYVGHVTYALEDICKSYSIIKEYMQNRFLHGYKKIILTDPTEFDDLEDSITVKKIRATDIYDAIYLNDINRINIMLDDYRASFIINRNNEEYIKLSYYNLYKDIVSLIKHRVPELEDAMSEENDLLSRFTMTTSLQELHGFIKYKILLLAEQINSIGLDSPIGKTIDYIDRNFDQDIKIEKLAELMHYSCSYIGKMIKDELGESFNSYLNRKRIEKAKELLGQNMKISDVAEKVGYKNSNLFFSYFKKAVGCTPLEYKKSLE